MEKHELDASALPQAWEGPMVRCHASVVACHSKAHGAARGTVVIAQNVPGGRG